ncbi:hypothetical protein D081_1648 [Anaerovibrio sp. JC8]|nr:hypothetical protein D081_1648 [Anaerovibrio sp. JC8]
MHTICTGSADVSWHSEVCSCGNKSVCLISVTCFSGKLFTGNT